MIEELKSILGEITGSDICDLNENNSLFSMGTRVRARDVFLFFLEIENRYGVLFTSDKINDPNFFTLERIAYEMTENMKKL